MKYLLTLLLLAFVSSLYAAAPGTIVCRPYENVWFDSSRQGPDKIEHAREHGKLNGRNLEIIVNFRKHFVMNSLDDKKNRESLMHANGNVYYVKGKEKKVYFGAYTFDKDYRSAIYSADGVFATFLQCKPYNTGKRHSKPRG